VTFHPGAYGAPGQRMTVKATETESTNLWLLLKQATMGALALDVFTLIPMVAAALLGRAMFPLLGLLAGYIVGPALRLFTYAWDRPREASVVWGTCIVLGGVVGLSVMDRGWAWFGLGFSSLAVWLRQLVAPYGWWTIAVLAAALGVGLIRKQPRAFTILAVGGLLSWGVLYHAGNVFRVPIFGSFSLGTKWTPGYFALAWYHLRLLFLPLLWPWLVFSVVLAARLIAELVFGTTIPLQVMPAELSQMSPLDILVPGISNLWREHQEEQASIVKHRYTVTLPRVGGEPDVQMFDVPAPKKNPERYADFIRATLLRHTDAALGVGITNRGATEYGYTYGQTRRRPTLFDILEDNGYTVDGAYTEKGLAWAVQVVVEHRGLDAVPEGLRGYAPTGGGVS